MFYWYIGDRKLNTEGNRMIVETEEVEEEGSNAVEFVTTAIFRYIPSAADHGKFLSCRAVNEHFPARPKEDGYSLDVKCKFSFPRRALCQPFAKVIGMLGRRKGGRKSRICIIPPRGCGGDGNIASHCSGYCP